MHDDYFTITQDFVRSGTDGHRTAVIHLGGEFDLGARDELRDALVAAADADGMTLITVDLHDVTFMDSEGVSAVMAGYLAAEQADIAFRLRRANGIVNRVFEVIGLAHLFDGDAPDAAQR